MAGAVEEDREPAVVQVAGGDLRLGACLTGFVLHVGDVARQAGGRPDPPSVGGEGVAVVALHLVVAVRINHRVAEELDTKQISDRLSV